LYAHALYGHAAEKIFREFKFEVQL
jgi:hypothetical protein